jgi:hypothetical protein
MSDSPNIMKATLDWDGDKYVLQHPGVRAWLLKFQDYFSKDDTIQLVPFLDWCFEEVVFPEKGEKLTVDTLAPKRAMDWAALLQGFLSRGELYAGFKWSNIEGEGLTHEEPDETNELGSTSRTRVASTVSRRKRRA